MPAGRQLVVVLDHGDVVEAHALVGAAAGADRVLLQRPQARRGLAGVQHHRLRAGQRVGPGAGVGGHAGHAAQQVQRGALGGEQRPGRAGDRRRARRRGRTRSPSRGQQPTPRRSTAGTWPRRRRRRPPASPATTPSARATRSAVSVWSAGMVATLVTSRPIRAQVLGQRALDDPAVPAPDPAQPPATPSPSTRSRSSPPTVCVDPALRPDRARAGGRSHSSSAVGKSSRQWQPRVSRRRTRPRRPARGHGEQVRRLPGGGPRLARGLAELGQRPRPSPASVAGRAQHPGAPGHRPLQRSPRHVRGQHPARAASRRRSPPARPASGRSGRCRRRSGGRRPAPPAASCWPAGWRRARRCRPPRRRRTGRGWRCGRAGRCGRRRRRSGRPARPGSGRSPGRRRPPGRTPRWSGSGWSRKSPPRCRASR